MPSTPVTWTATVAAARRPSLAPANVLVIASGALVGLALLLSCARLVSFPPVAQPAAIGWTTVNQYPKYQEQIYFLLTVGGVPGVAALAWLTWVTVATGLARLGRQPPTRVLQQTALGAVAVGLLLPGLLKLDLRLWRMAGPGAAIMAAWTLGCLWWNRRAARARGPGPVAAVLPAVAPAGTDAGASGTGVPTQSVGTRSRRLLRVAWGLLIYVAVPAAVYALRYNPAIDGGVDLFHEGEFLAPLNELLHGGIPYRDIYLQHGLFHNALIPWLGAHLFGPTLAGVRTMQHLVEPLGAVALYFFALSLFRGRLLTALVVAWLCCGDLPAPARAMFGFLAFALVAADQRPLSEKDGLLGAPLVGRLSPKAACRWRFGLAGGLSALAFWHSAEIGLYTTAAITLFLTLADRRRAALGWYAAGVGAGFCLVGWYFLVHGAIPDLVHNVFVQMTYQTEVWGLPFPKFFGTIGLLFEHPGQLQWPQSFLGDGMWHYLPPTVFMVAAIHLAYRGVRGRLVNSPGSRRLLLLVLAGCCYFRTALGRSDWWHLHYGILFTTLTAMYLPDQLLGAGLAGIVGRDHTRWQRARAAAVLVTGLVVGWGVWNFAWTAYHPWTGLRAGWQRLTAPPPRTHATGVALERVGRVDIPAGQLAQLRGLVALIHERTGPQDRVFDFTNQAAVLFFADRRSATRYFQICYAATVPLQREVTSSLAQSAPLAMLAIGPVRGGFDGIAQSDRTPLVAAYLKEHYTPEPRSDPVCELGVPAGK